MNHRSIPSFSSSISSHDSPRTSSSSCYYNPLQLDSKKSTETTNSSSSPTSVKRWDDSQLEMELAEDDLISSSRKVRRNSSLRLKQKLNLKSKFSTITPKDDKELITKYNQKVITQGNKFSKSMKKVYQWILS